MTEDPKLKAQNQKLPILVGPTGVGKSEIAFHLAQRLRAEILSADAFQVYEGLAVGTAQPPREWLEKIPHHLIGCRPISRPWNAVEFALAASRIIRERAAQGRRLLLVGGAGFYLRALVEGPPPGNAPTPEIRSMVLEKVREAGAARAHQWLQERDAAAAARLHPNDLQRICRALEKTFQTGAVEMDWKPLGSPSVCFIGLERSRESLDRMLRSRAEGMWGQGLLEETQGLVKQGLPQDHPLWGAIGYSEAAAFLQGRMKKEEALEMIFRRTRQYAKRQWTWFKHQHQVEWVDLDSFSDVLSAVDMVERKLQGALS